MPTAITLGHIEAHEKLTARLFVQPTGELGYVDCGNVADYKHTPEKQYKTRMVAEGGFRRVNDEQVDTVHDRWEFTLDEMDAFNHRLLHLARRQPDRCRKGAPLLHWRRAPGGHPAGDQPALRRTRSPPHQRRHL